MSFLSQVLHTETPGIKHANGTWRISRFMLGFVGIVSQIEVVIFHCSNHWSNWVSVFHMLNYLKLWNSDQLFNRQPPFLPIQWVVICCHMIMTQPHIIGVPAHIISHGWCQWKGWHPRQTPSQQVKELERALEREGKKSMAKERSPGHESSKKLEKLTGAKRREFSGMIHNHWL